MTQQESTLGSPTILNLQGAWILPPVFQCKQFDYPVNDYAVLDENGEIVELANLYREERLNYPDNRVPPENAEYLPGSHLFGGLLFNHFGHAFTESTTRLYALKSLLGEVESILFTGTTPSHKEANKHAASILNALGIEIPYRIVHQPTKVERLFVPEQLGGLGPRSKGHPELHRFFADACEKIPAEGPEKLFISRAHYMMRRGGILAEPVLERNFLDQGFTLFSPERSSLQTQIARYRAAKVVVGLDSSAFHIASATCNHDLQPVIVLRRHHGAVDIGPQLSAFLGRDPLICNHIEQLWRCEEGRMKPWDFFAKLDFLGLGKQLLAEGIVDPRIDWSIPEDKDYVFHPG